MDRSQSRGEQTRAKMLESTVALLAERGVAGTSFRDVVEHASAPRGSIYFHFPDGKRQLVADAVGLASERSTRVFEQAAAAGAPPAALLAALCAFHRVLLERSGCTAGCPVAAVATGTPDDDELARAAARVFSGWRELIAARLVEAGCAPAAEAESLADLVVAAVQGSLVLCRAERSTAPLDRVEAQLAALLEQRGGSGAAR